MNADEGGVMSTIRRKALEGLQVGDSFSVSRIFTEEDVKKFAEISKDYNPVHFEERFAKAKQFDGCICHGLLVATLLTEIGGQIGWLASGMNIKFVKPVYIGNTVTCDFAIVEIDDRNRASAEIVFLNESGTVVLEAIITGVLPDEREQKIMKKMMEEGDPTNGLVSG